MSKTTRRRLLSGLAASPIAMPAITRAQSSSKPIRIGLLSDMGGPYADVGGLGNRVATELAIQDFGGSVLGRPIEVLQADCQNKPDIATSLSREWIDRAGVDVLADGAATSSGLAIQQICRDKRKTYLITGPASSDMTGKLCSPYGVHFSYDTFALAHGTGTAVTKNGAHTWYFITADYGFGYALERDTMDAVTAAGGKVLGSTRAPLGTTDYSFYLLQAQASRAQVIAFAIAGSDLQNAIKQASEFGLMRSGAKMTTLLMQISDIGSIGQKNCVDLTYTDSFYWDINDNTRAWARRWAEKMGGRQPGMLHAGSYCAAFHWLKAVKAAGTTESDAVVAKMKATPINDFYNDNVAIRSDGRVMHKMYLWRIKPPAASESKYDVAKLVDTIGPDDAWRPLKDGACPLVRV